MPYIKKLSMHGFKSFPRKTEIPFTPEINVVLGPNGSGKSNISDALCFVLGRLSAKSMRAAKAKNLIFSGTKIAAPSKEAMVELVFDNSDKGFTIEQNEVSIKRIVRRNGQSIYRINNQTKTRQEVLTLLAQTGIDPNGFNIIQQGEIQNFVRMHTEERRQVIEEVSGISIYESRKEKSLKELEKTEERLKSVLTILRERTTYLNNLEKERQQALKFKKLEKDSKKYNASIINTDLTRKNKEIKILLEDISNKVKLIEKLKKDIIGIKSSIENFESKINGLNSTIQQTTGLEQERINQEIANFRAELAVFDVNYENFEKKLFEINKQKQQNEETIRNNEVSIKELKNETPSSEKTKKDMDSKKQELEELEEQRKKFYTVKSELKSFRERIQDKTNILQNYESESSYLLKQIEGLTLELFDNKSDMEKLKNSKILFAEKKESLKDIEKKEIDLEKKSHTNEYEIERQKKLIDQISKMDVCPLCKSKITKEHIDSINLEINPNVNLLEKEIEEADKRFNDIYEQKEILNRDIDQIGSEISKRESDLVNISNINGKKEQIKVLQENINNIQDELLALKNKERKSRENFDENLDIEQKYETLKIEVQEISLRSNKNVHSEISFKQREFERSKIFLKQLLREESDLKEDIDELKKDIGEKKGLLDKKKKQEEELREKCQGLISERDLYQKKIRETEYELSSKENNVHNIEQEINNLKIEKAKLDAEAKNLETEMLGFPNVEIIKTNNREVLVQKLNNIQGILEKIGTSVNLRSLQVYDEVKKEYDAINERVEVISKEKEGILKIVHEIDIKKKKTFMTTFNSLNEIFSRNFAQISTKGHVFLEIENKKDPFQGGVGIVVKTGHGKYFDVTSLSGGEQTMVALSLIFGIQELKPYSFYILDEIDAALDKRNSERLAALLKKYMQKGQYIVITHNDEIITNASILYGVSMFEGVSKIVSLKI